MSKRLDWVSSNCKFSALPPGRPDLPSDVQPGPAPQPAAQDKKIPISKLVRLLELLQNMPEAGKLRGRLNVENPDPEILSELMSALTAGKKEPMTREASSSWDGIRDYITADEAILDKLIKTAEDLKNKQSPL